MKNAAPHILARTSVSQRTRPVHNARLILPVRLSPVASTGVGWVRNVFPNMTPRFLQPLSVQGYVRIPVEPGVHAMVCIRANLSSATTQVGDMRRKGCRALMSTSLTLSHHLAHTQTLATNTAQNNAGMSSTQPAFAIWRSTSHTVRQLRVFVTARAENGEEWCVPGES